MIIALTGTPGTGKSAAARILRRLGERVIDLNALAQERGLLGRLDRRRRTREVDIAALGRLVGCEHPGRGRLFLEGHISHLLDVDRAVVLRCRPDILRRRLARRGYPGPKVRENSLAEALDVITAESVGRLGSSRVFELDTTGQRPADIAREILLLCRRGFRGPARFRPGRIDWSEDIIRNTNYYQ